MVKLEDNHQKRFLRSYLFSKEFLNNHLVDLEEFQALDVHFLKEKLGEIRSLYSEGLKDLKESQLENNFLQPIFRILGHTFEVQTAKKSDEEFEGTKSIDYAFFYSEEDKLVFQKNDNPKNAIKYASCSTICETKKWGILDGYDTVKRSDNTCPIWQLKMSYLDNINPKEQKATVPFGILTDGKSWRIYSYRAETDKFLEINLEHIITKNDFEAFKVFWFFFSKEAFRGKSHLSIVESGSKKLQAEVSSELRKQVYLSLELIATGIFRVYNSGVKDWDVFLKYPELKNYMDANDLEVVDITNPELEHIVLNIIYSESLVYLFRVLFLLYADHRNLFKHPKVETVFYNLLSKIENYTTEIGSITEKDENIAYRNDDYDINGVFDEIDSEFNGGLFNQKLHPILKLFDIDNVLYANAIDYLTRTYDKKTGKPQRVDFSALEVRHLGTIYEGLLEYKLKRVEDETYIPLLSDKKKKRHLLKDDLYLVNDKGERKATGSYYTPDYIVEYIVKNTVGPLVDEIEKEEISPQQKIAKIFGLRICDPAMGSGHFLVEVINYLNDRISDLIQNALEPLLKKPGRKSKQVLDYEELLSKCESGFYKQIIGKRCIYGVDKNKMAVELAKLSIWIFTLQKGRKLEFFDYNLRCGDSLIGSQEKTFSARIETESKERMLFASDEELYQNVINDFKDAFQKYFEFDSVEKRIEYYESVIRPNQQKLKFLANVELALDFAGKDDKIRGIYSAHKNELLQLIRQDTKNEYLKKLAKGKDVSEWELTLYKRARQIRDEYTPIHWELDFPNVFIDKGGFDVVIGNPPYVPLEETHTSIKLYYNKNFKYIEKKYDSSILFILKGLTLFSKNGYLGYISSITWQTGENTYKLREKIFSNHDIIKIINLPFNVFFDAYVDTCIYILNSKKRNKFYNIYSFDKNEKIKSLDQIKFNTIDINDIVNNNYKIIDNNEIFSIANKLRNNKNIFELGSISESTQGLAGNKYIIEDKQINSFYYPYLVIGQSYRYQLNIIEVRYTSMENYKSLIRFYSKNIRILIRRIINRQNRLMATIQSEDMIVKKDLNPFIIIDNNFETKYVLTIINSKLISYFYLNQSTIAVKDDFRQTTLSELRKLPIKKIPFENQTPFINRADIMLSKNKELQELNNNFWELLLADVELESIPKKLETWYQLDWKDFVAELRKKKVTLSGELEEKWFDRFKRKKEEALSIKNIIDKTDEEIDLMVYKLYELTYEEVKIVDSDFKMSKNEYDGYEIPRE